MTSGIDQRLHVLRSRICDGCLIGIAVAIMPALAASLYRIVDTGWLPVMGLHVALTAAMFAVVAVRGRLPYAFRASFLILFFWLIGTGALATNGTAAIATALFLVAAVLGFLLYGPAVGSGVTAACVATAAAAWGAIEAGWIAVDPQRVLYQTEAPAWLLYMLALVFMVVGLGTALTVLQRHLLAAIEESERERSRLYDLISHAPDGIVLADETGVMLQVNRQLETMFGYPSGELVGRPVEVLVPAAVRAAHAGHRGGYVAAGVNRLMEFDRGELLGVRSDGTEFPVSVSLSLYDQGGVRHTIAVVRDVTEERVVNQQLVQAAKLATLGEMATGIAHELNQPLSVIRLAAEGLVERIDDGDRDIGMIRDKLDRIGRQTARAAAIIDHMRIFGRKAEGPTVAFDPRRAVEDALGIVGERLRLRGIDVRLDLGADCAAVRGHPILLEQVVLNLLTNAFDALELREDAAGTASIEVRVRGESGGREVRIDIRDNGGGVSEAVIRRVFEPFVTTKPVGKGTGLGLSVSYGIVTDMGGSISVRNADGGAEFTIVLPAAGAEGATAA